MYLKDKKTVTLGSIVGICYNNRNIWRKAEISKISFNGNFRIDTVDCEYFYYARKDFTVRGTDDKILFRLKLIKKIKYKRKRYKNG